MLEVQQRSLDRLRYWYAQHPNGIIALVSHGDVIRAILTFFLGMPLDLYYRLAIAPASLSVLVLRDDNAHVLRLNDTGTLPI